MTIEGAVAINAGVLAQEGREAWAGESCCVSAPMAELEQPSTCDDHSRR